MPKIKTGVKQRVFGLLFLTIAIGLFVFGLSHGVAGYSVAFNTSKSLGGWVYLINQNEKHIKKGELVAFIAPKNKYYSNYNRFIKYTWGVAGDNVQFEKNGTFLINGQVKGVAKSLTKSFEPLVHADGGVIPEGKFFAGTNHLDSFDSRYKLVGNIDEKNIIGRAYLLF